MKKVLQVLSILASAVVIISCKTTAQVAQNEQAVTAVKPINWQGAELGLQIPEWVLYVASQDYEALNNLPEAKEKRLLPITGSGADKDLLKSGLIHRMHHLNFLRNYSRQLLRKLQAV